MTFGWKGRLPWGDLDLLLVGVDGMLKSRLELESFGRKTIRNKRCFDLNQNKFYGMVVLIKRYFIFFCVKVSVFMRSLVNIVVE